MSKEISDHPPSYTEAIKSPATLDAPPVMKPPPVGAYQDSFQSSAPPPPPPMGQPMPGYVPTYGTIDMPPQVNVPVTIVIGGCPSCRIGFLEDSYSCLGLFCAIFFFPVGILCCLALKNKRCSNCGAEF